MNKKMKGEIDLINTMNRIKQFRQNGWGLGTGAACGIVTNQFDRIVKDKRDLTLKQVEMLRKWCNWFMPGSTSTIRGCVEFSGLASGTRYMDCNGVERLA